jgi:predicted ATPase/DNA-binding SARP family transcriptional activator
MATILRLLGVPELERDGLRIPLAPGRHCQLGAYVALRADWVQRDALADLFYPERNHDAARSNLRKLLAQLRGDRDLAAQLEENGAALRWPIDTDVARFEAAVVARDDQRVVDLYRGPLLLGFKAYASSAFAEWLTFERQRLHAVWRDSALRLLEDGVDRTDLAARVVAADPLDEVALRAQLRQLARCGQRGAARHAYDEFARRVAQDLGIEPSRETRDLLPAIEADFVPATATSRGGTGFVGRRAELRTLAALFAQPECRLVTIVGVGGVGKSALARQALAELAPSLADHAAFVVLEDLAQPQDLGARVARDIGLALAGTDAPLAQVARRLAAHRWLLALDGFEQTAGAVGLLTWLVERCPQLRVIVTSRVRLALEREWLLPLDGLPTPSPEDDERAEMFDSVRLYAWHAHEADPSFTLETERKAVAEICRLVEGLPLAIEMASAWTRLLGCRAIADDVKRGTALLVGSDRPRRQASIEAVFEQSWRLLTLAERDALAGLSVFHDGCTHDAARRVAGAVLPVLAALADKSLLRVEAGRFRLHALIAQWAGGKLGERGARGATEQLHFDYYARLLGRVVNNRGAAAVQALADVEPDLGNLLAAWRFGIEHGRADMLDAAATLARFFQIRGRSAEGLRWLEAAHAAFGDSAADACHLLAALANLEYRTGRYADSERHAAAALGTFRENGDARGAMNCLNMLGATALQSGRFEASVEYFDEALGIARRDRDRDSETAFLQNLAQALQMRGAYDAALARTQEALALARGRGDRELQLIALNNVGNLTRILGHPAESVAAVTEALAIAQAAQLRGYRAALLTNLALAHMDLPDLDAAGEFASRALAELNEGGEPSLECLLRCVLGRIATARCEFEHAAREFATALSWCREHGYLPGMLHGLVVSAERLVATGARDEAARIVALALRHPATERTDADFARALVDRHALELPHVDADAKADAVLLDTVVARLLAATG